MLYRIEIENFYSIKEPQVLDLRIAKNVPDYPERFAPIFPGAAERAPKVVMLLGPNGSGKSTVLKALPFIAWFIGKSLQRSAPLFRWEGFNDEESITKPIRLAIELGGLMDLSFAALDAAGKGEGTFGTYRYELELLPKDGAINTVVREVLRQKRNGRGKWTRVFDRESDGTLRGSRIFPLSGFSKIIDKIRPDASVIATLALLDHEPSRVIINATEKIIMNILTDRIEMSDTDAIKYLSQNPSSLESLNHELQRIDVGIERMRIEHIASGPIALFKHEGLYFDMPISMESHGTRSFIRIFPLLFFSLEMGGIAIVDELDLSIHPLLLPEIVRWFYDPKRNLNDAQLWASCHSVSLLEDLTKEEVVLCEKDRLGRTGFHSLMDVQAVRRSDNLYKKYLGGTYGAVPQIG